MKPIIITLSQEFHKLNHLIKIFKDCFEGINYVIKVYDDYANLLLDKNLESDLILLDIDNNGMKIAQIIRESGYNGDVIFYASSKNESFLAYQLHPFDYLLKPITETKLEETLIQYRTIKLKECKMLSVKDSRKNEKYKIPLHKIEYVESSNTKLTIHLVDNNQVKMYGKLSDIENEMGTIQLLRCHQSFLINMNFVDKVDEVFEMRTGAKVPIKVRSKRKIKNIYYQYIFSK